MTQRPGNYFTGFPRIRASFSALRTNELLPSLSPAPQTSRYFPNCESARTRIKATRTPRAEFRWR